MRIFFWDSVHFWEQFQEILDLISYWLEVLAVCVSDIV